MKRSASSGPGSRPVSDPARRPRAEDVATLAGVSPATVDRVLNRRAHVRSATAERVIEAAARLRYLPKADLFAALRPKPMRLTFILPSGTNRYLRMLGAYIGQPHDQYRAYNVACRCVFVESFNPAALAQAILHHARRSDGVAFMALDHDLVREAVAKVGAAGKPVLTLISDLPDSGRIAYLGLDNIAAGRTAALVIGRMAGERRGDIGLIAGSLAYRAHSDREIGFRALMAEQFPQLGVVQLQEGHDDAGENYRAARAMLAQHPRLIGIYNIGGAPAGIGRAIRELGPMRRIIFVAHALSPDTRSMLAEGLMDFALTQSHEKTAFNAIRIFTNIREGRDPEHGVDRLTIELVTGENIPASVTA